MMYEVLKCEGKTGLTLGARVLAPGQKFSEKDWPYGDDALKAAIENKRCKEVKESEPAKKEVAKEAEPEAKGKAKKKEAEPEAITEAESTQEEESSDSEISEEESSEEDNENSDSGNGKVKKKGFFK